MKRVFLLYLFFGLSVFSFNSFSQTGDQEMLGLPGDNLDLYAVLDVFQKSKTIEDFEKTLNQESTGINNLDLNNDSKVDFIKVNTEQDGDDFMFVLRDDISEKETQDIAVILVSKDENEKITLQIVGDELLYGKDYIVEPKTEPTPSVTANPGYAGDEPVAKNIPATEVVDVQTAPIVQYVYSPVYVPYYPPYYYGYYPPYFAAFTVVAIGVYRHNHYYHHHGYHHTVVIHNHHHYNNYNNYSRRNSVYVNNNVRSGNYNTGGRGSTRPSTTSRSSTTARPKTSNSTGSRTRSNYSQQSTRSFYMRSRSRGRG